MTEVERQTWDRKKKKKQRDTYGYVDDSINLGSSMQHDASTDNVVLHYGELDSLAGPEVPKLQTDWQTIEEKWDALLLISNASALSVGLKVGWKVSFFQIMINLQLT